MLLGGGSVWFNGRIFGGNPQAKLVWKYHRYVTFLKPSYTTNCVILIGRLSGYIIYPLYLFTVYLGGAWSSWSGGHSVFIVRLLAFTLAPAVLLLAVLSRVRCVVLSHFFVGIVLLTPDVLCARLSKMKFF